MNKQTTCCRILVLSVVVLLITAMPLPIFAQTQKGIELFNSWKFPEAEKVLREAVKANPQDLTAEYYLGLSALLQDKHNEALDIFLKLKNARDKMAPKARPAVPDDFQIQIALARTRLELKQDDEAWKNLEAAEKDQPDAADVYVYRGAYYLQKQKNQQAIKELEKAIALDSHNAYAYYYAGHAYLRTGNPSKAVEEFKTFLQLAPLAPEAVKAKALVDALC
jgi:tetratricopeptide (TPR) repeat protein